MDEATPHGAVCRTCCGALNSAEEEEEEQASRLNEGTTGGPSSEEIATQVSFTAWRGELTVSAISGETVANEGYCDGAAVLSIDEVLGHVLSASLSSAPSLSERLGVVMTGSPRQVSPLAGPRPCYSAWAHGGFFHPPTHYDTSVHVRCMCSPQSVTAMDCIITTCTFTIYGRGSSAIPLICLHPLVRHVLSVALLS